MKKYAMCRYVRTEYAKQIRKAYEHHEIQIERSKLNKLELRNDMVCNTLTSVNKDNLILEITEEQDD